MGWPAWRRRCREMISNHGIEAMKTGHLPPMEGKWSKRRAHLEPVFGGILRVWSNGGKSPALYVCAGAGARGWCDITLHCSISSIRRRVFSNKILKGLANLGVCEMEQSSDLEVMAWL